MFGKQFVTKFTDSGSLLKASEKGQGDVLKANGCLGFLGIPFITKILQPKLEEGRG